MAIENYKGYFDPDDEDELVESDVHIDPAWESQQKKTFTAWCNAHLRKVNSSIENIEHDFRDGRKLMQLLEVISGEHFSKPDRGKMRLHHVANVNKCLDYIGKHGVKLVSIGAEEIVDGNTKMTLGMIWTIILRFAISAIQMEEFSSKEGLLFWCQRQTAPYKNVKIDNFHTSFRNGLAFCAIIHRNRPDLINYAELSAKNPLHNLNLAFSVAEKELDIPRILDPEDMVKSAKPDEKSVMACLTFYFQAFSGAMKAHTATNRIASMVKLSKENNQLIGDYDNITTDLLDWINKKLESFSSRSPEESLQGIEGLQSALRLYRGEEKPKKLKEKARLETIYNTLQTRLRLNNRPPFVPEHEKLITAITEKWNQLEEAERAYDDWLLEERQRMRRVDLLLNKFRIRCSTHEAWAADKPDTFVAKDHEFGNLTELRATMKKMEAFEFELVANDDRVERIHLLLGELEKLRYHDMESLTARYNAIVTHTGCIKRYCEELMDECKRILPIAEEIDQNQLQYAKQAAHFQIWHDQTKEDLQDDIIVDSPSELQRYKEAHSQFQGTLVETDKVFQSITACAQEAKRLADQHGLKGFAKNPYTDIKPETLMQGWAQIQGAAKHRIDSLQVKGEQQIAHDKLRNDFTHKACALDKRLQECNAEVRKCATESKETLEEQIARLNSVEGQMGSFRKTLEELEQMHVVLEDHAPDASSSLTALRVQLSELFISVKNSVTMMENQARTRDSKGLSKEQMQDMRACFNHFDKNDSQTLDRNEFKACLMSTGHCSFDDSVAGETEFAKIMQQVDPANTGDITFDAFLDYMTREIVGEDTEEQIRQAFKVMAGEKGYVCDADLRRHLSPEDAEYCIEQMSRLNGPMGDNGALNYEGFVEVVYGGGLNKTTGQMNVNKTGRNNSD